MQNMVKNSCICCLLPGIGPCNKSLLKQEVQKPSDQEDRRIKKMSSSESRLVKPGLDPVVVNHQAAPHNKLGMHMQRILITGQGGEENGRNASRPIATALHRNQKGEVEGACPSGLSVSEKQTSSGTLTKAQ